MRGNHITRIRTWCMALVCMTVVSAQTNLHTEVKQKTSKPLAGYTAILVEKIIRLNSQVNIFLYMGPSRFDTNSIQWL